MSSRDLFFWLLFGAALFSAWLAWLQPEPVAPVLDGDGKALPDYYLTRLNLAHYGEDGQLARVLKAERMTHVAGQGTRLKQPRLTVHTAEGSPWQISGESGNIDPDGKILTLPGEVLITRLATPHNRPVRLQTRDLRYQPAEGYAETDRAVTLTSEQDRIDAVGLKAWLQSPGHIQFLSQVRAHYEPQ